MLHFFCAPPMTQSKIENAVQCKHCENIIMFICLMKSEDLNSNKKKIPSEWKAISSLRTLKKKAIAIWLR